MNFKKIADTSFNKKLCYGCLQEIKNFSEIFILF